MDERIRDELARRAEEADVSAPVRQRVLAGVGRRRRWVRPVLAGSVAVAATVAMVAVVTRDVPRNQVAPAPPAPTPSATADWRPESWRGLTVDVPADWGYSAAPIGRNLLCDERPDAPGYVGRPLMLTDVCGTYVEGQFPNGERAPYVWLGTELVPGTVDLPGEGWVQETVGVQGTTLTVASDDPELRAAVLGSVRETELCPSTLPDLPEPLQSMTRDGLRDLVPDRLTVCAYRRDDASSVVALTYAARADAAASRTYAAVVESRVAGCISPDSGPEWEWVTLLFEGPVDAGSARFRHEMVAHMGGRQCPRVAVNGSRSVILTPAMIEPWAVGGVPYVVVGPSGGKGAMIDSFIGMLG